MSRRQEFRHHGVVDRQRTADPDPCQQPEKEQHLEAGRKGGGQPEHGIDRDRDNQHAAAANPIGKATKAPGTGQHAEKQRRSGLDGLWYRQSKVGCKRRRGEADRQDLHGVRSPDEAENRQQTIMKGSCANPAQRLIDCHCRH